MNNRLLLLHGALGSKDQFKQLKERLTSRFEVFDLNFEGHGNNLSGKDFSINLFTENVIDFLTENDIGKIDIFGYSMGGYVALNVAKKAPGLVDRIMTFGTKFDWTKETAEKEIRMLDPAVIEQKVPAFAGMLEDVHRPNDWKEVVNKTARMMLGLGSGQKLTRQDLESIEHAVLITIGSNDHMVSIAESAASAECLPNGRLRVIDHFVHPIEKNDIRELESIIVQFLKPDA